MSKKKITLTIMSIVIAILVMIIPNIAKASTTLTTPLYFGINEFRDGKIGKITLEVPEDIKK